MAKHYLESRENLVNLLSTAFYGSYWFCARTPKEFREKYRDGFDNREDRWAQILLDGGYIYVIDSEEDGAHKITLDMLRKSWNSEDKQIVRAKANILDEQDDFYDDDAIVQYAIFGEVVYG